MRLNKWILMLSLIIIIIIGTGCQMTSNLATILEQTTQTQAPTNAPQQIVPTLPQSTPSDTITLPDYALIQDSLVSLYEQFSPGVVSIQVTSNLGTGQGSGFVIDKEGHIITNFHVVQDALSMEVHFSSGLKVYGEVIGTDLDSDLAVIKVDVPADALVPLPLGDSDLTKVGQMVVAIGNPYGLSGTMTVGIVSARGRVLDSIRQTTEGLYFTAGDLIQTDASINPGNSGGPLLNLNGEVIGVNRAIQTSGSTITGDPVNTGIGFAVSSNILRRVVPSLISQGYYDYPYLGLSSLNSLNLTLQEALNLPQATGAYITSVISGGPADNAGMIAGTQQTQLAGIYAGGDLIIAVDGRPVREFSDLLSYMLLNRTPGEQLIFTILRNGEEIEVAITLGKRP